MLFFKYYDPETEQLRYVGRAHFGKNTKTVVRRGGKDKSRGAAMQHENRVAPAALRQQHA
jgi:hypothetical protein